MSDEPVTAKDHLRRAVALLRSVDNGADLLRAVERSLHVFEVDNRSQAVLDRGGAKVANGVRLYVKALRSAIHAADRLEAAIEQSTLFQEPPGRKPK